MSAQIIPFPKTPIPQQKTDHSVRAMLNELKAARIEHDRS